MCIRDSSDAAKGTTIASTMYASGVDVIYQAAGGTGTGVFTAAKDVNEKLDADSDKKVWVIGVDRDQTAEGNYTSSDKKKSNFCLLYTSHSFLCHFFWYFPCHDCHDFADSELRCLFQCGL